MSTKNEIVPVERYAALATTPDEVLRIVQQNIGNDQITAQDLDRVTLPLGGATNWSVPSLEGEESMQYIDGIIVHLATPRAYWESSLDDGEGSGPPDCSSEDSQWGVGTPGGDCFKCKLGEWGSADRGQGKACKEKRLLYVLRADAILPIVIQGPATSIGNIKKYMLRLANARTPYWQVYTRLGLEKQSGGVFTYSRIVPTSMGAISEEDSLKVQAYVDSIKPLVAHPITLARDED
jgi:hypothetical protein